MGKKTVELAKKQGSGKLGAAKDLLGQAQDAGGALAIVLKALGYDPVTGENLNSTNGGPTDALSKYNEQVFADKKVKYDTLRESLAAENPGWTPENIDKAAYDAVYGSDVTGGAGKSVSVTADTSLGGLAKDTFKETLSLLVGEEEAKKGYVDKLYELTSGFYKTGSTIDESINLALYKAKNENVIPEFTDRFAGLFELQDQLKAGKAVQVPTIAQFIKTESAMGELLTNAGLGDLNNQQFLGSVIGKGKSVLEVGNLVSDVFNTIDTAPTALKTDLATYFPGVDKTSIAKALLLGPEGAKQLSDNIKGITVQSAAKTQGVNLTLGQATDLSAQTGYDYNQSISAFSQVKDLQNRANALSQYGGGKFTQEQALGAIFGKSLDQQQILEQLKQAEASRYQGSSGTTRGAFSTGYLNKQSSAGAF
jgi:hypothetical protein